MCIRDRLNEIGREFRRRFDGAAITKIVTIEASGIGIAAIAAQHFGDVYKRQGLGHEYFSRILESFRAQAEACGYDVRCV